MPSLEPAVRHPSTPRVLPSSLTLQAKAALYCAAGGESIAQVAMRLGFNAAYLGRLAASPAGRDFIASVEADARRERAKIVFAELADDLRGDR